MNVEMGIEMDGTMVESVNVIEIIRTCDLITTLATRSGNRHDQVKIRGINHKQEEIKIFTIDVGCRGTRCVHVVRQNTWKI